MDGDIIDGPTDCGVCGALADEACRPGCDFDAETRLRPIAWEHTEACACGECRLSKIKRAATRGRDNETHHATTETT